MAKPKLALIPATQGSKLYSVLPADGVGDFDFSRNSAATRINKDGLIETVAVGKSRLNYPLIDGVVNGCPSHLLENSATNKIPYSRDFSHSSWIKVGSSIGNYTISPDGTLNAFKLVEDTSNSDHYIRTPFMDTTDGNTLNTSLFVKSDTRDEIIITEDAWNANYVKVNLTDETFITTGISAGLKKLTNGWYRIDIQDIARPSTRWRVGLAVNGTPSYQGDGQSGLYIYGFQMVNEAKSVTSYIPTSGSAVTRVAETANGAGDASTFNDSEGVLMVETKVLDISTSNSWISLSEDANINNNQFNLRFVADSNLIQAVSRAGGLGQDVVLQYTLTDKTLTNKISIKYKLNDWALWVNGFEVDTETSSNAFTPNSLDVLDFDRGNNSNNFYGNTKQIQYFDSALNDSELETLTSWVSFTDMANGQLYTIE